MKKLKNKNIVSLISILSFGTIIVSIAGSIVSNNINKSQILSENSLNSVSPRYTSITKLPPSLTATGDLINKYPIELITTDSSLLKQLIISSIIDPALPVNENDIKILEKETIVNNLDGKISLVFNLINYKAVINKGGSLITVNEKKFIVEIVNLKNVIPSNIPATDSTVELPSEYSSYTNVQATTILQDKILPAVIGGTQLSSFNIELIEFEPIFPNKMKVNMAATNYFNQTGELINYSGLLSFTISGFKPLQNSTYNSDIDASSLGISITDINLQNTFSLIKNNTSNLSKELSISDIQNFSVNHIFSAKKAILNFDIVNYLWVENAVVPSKHIVMTLFNLNSSLNTTIDSLIKSDFLSAYTSSEVKATSPNDDWKNNNTLKTIISSNIVDSAPGVDVNAVDIEITSVSEKNPIGNGNYEELYVEFNLINSSAIVNGEIVNSLHLSTTITGFKAMQSTFILEKILANSSNDSEVGFKSYDNIYANRLSRDEAKLIIASHINNTNGIVSANDIEITSFVPSLNDATIDVTFNLINSKFRDENGDVLVSKTMSTQIFGLKFFNGQTTFNGLSNDLTLDNTSSFLAPFNLPANILLGRLQLVEAIIRSYVSGPTPDTLNITISNAQVEGNTTLKFDVAITNYYGIEGIVTTPKVFTNIKIINLPSNTITSTYINPIIPVKSQNNLLTKITIDDLRPVNGDFSELKGYIASNIVNPLRIVEPDDIEIVSTTSNNPVYSGLDNSISVTFKILNNKYKDPTGLGVVSPEMKVKFVGFTPVSLINQSNYSIQTINNPKIANIYASEFLSKNINDIQNSNSYTIAEKNLLIQNLLSQFVSINLSNLNLNQTSFRFTTNDNQGSLNISVYSYGFYNQSGVYIQTDSPIANINLLGFATNKLTIATTPQWTTVPVLQIFASDVSLFNIADIVTFNNLPVGVVPQYEFDATDVVIQNGVKQDYGLIKVSVTLPYYFNSSGVLTQGPKKFENEFKTLPFLNTQLDLKDGVVVNYSEKSYTASKAPEVVIKRIISLKLTDLPSDFNIEKDIVLNSKESNDKLGEMTVSFDLSNYYRDGQISNEIMTFNNIKIVGFYPGYTEEKAATPFYLEQWFWLIAGVTVGSLLLLLIILLAVKIRRRNK